MTEAKWYVSSRLTGTYIADLAHTEADPMARLDPLTADVIQTANNAFLRYVDETHPCDYPPLQFSAPLGWLHLSGRLAKAYRKSHYALLESDPDYADALGNVLDTFEEIAAGKRPTPNPRRHKQEGHAMMVEATREGIATVVACFAVAGECVRQSYPDAGLSKQVGLAHALMPAARTLSAHMARLSKHGNEKLLYEIASPRSFATNGKIDYRKLVYRASAFQIIEAGQRPAIVAASSHHETHDTLFPFGGCPSVRKGSAQRLTQLIFDIVDTQKAYEQMFGVDMNRRER